MCHHPKRFSEDCVDFNMHEEKMNKEITNDLLESKPTRAVQLPDGRYVTEQLARQMAHEGLDEAANAFAWKNFSNNHAKAAAIRGFKAGAEWDREQMMKKAVEADVMLTLHDKTGDVSLHTGYLPKELGIKCDDKVRIIIVKE